MATRNARKPLAIPTVLHPQGLLRLEQVLTLLGSIPTTSFYAGMRAGIYPLPVRISARTVAWRCADILQLLESFPTATDINPNATKAVAGLAAKRAQELV